MFCYRVNTVKVNLFRKAQSNDGHTEQPKHTKG